eukprot:TRINITY_DN3354_c0_g1_i1.p1 TRINITY_DN3354_c0_g1~~TRINITY_DN3354_c0_g1_i1.p1  ORF type:complete len:361 (+),score=56.70 TRINITY_DN3354_c0_g1_i1:170-1252(+)
MSTAIIFTFLTFLLIFTHSSEQARDHVSVETDDNYQGKSYVAESPHKIIPGNPKKAYSREDDKANSGTTLSKDSDDVRKKVYICGKFSNRDHFFMRADSHNCFFVNSAQHCDICLNSRNCENSLLITDMEAKSKATFKAGYKHYLTHFHTGSLWMHYNLYHYVGYHVPFEKKKNKILAMISNCKAGRLEFVNELAKFVDLDYCGGCSIPNGNKVSCPSRSDYIGDQSHAMVSEYKFYLAAENTLCSDYISEKYWKTVHAGTIPVSIHKTDYGFMKESSRHKAFNILDQPYELFIERYNRMMNDKEYYEQNLLNFDDFKEIIFHNTVQQYCYNADKLINENFDYEQFSCDPWPAPSSYFPK